MKKNRRIVVIGGNASGAAAAAKAKRTSPDDSVFLIEKSNFIATGVCQLPYLISGEIDNYRDLIFYDEASFNREKGVEVLTNLDAASISTKEKTVLCNDLLRERMTEIPFDTLVLSTGSIVKKPAEFNASFSNVFTLKSVTDYTRWNQYCSENTIRDVLVIGAGVLGMELADTLAIANYQVTLIDSEQSPIASGGMSMSKLLLALLEKREIAFYSSAGRLQVNGTGGRVNTVKVDGRIISTDAVFLCSGFAPNTLLASTAGLELGACGGLKVDTHLATAGGTIYACGDMIEFAELVSGKPKLHNSAVFAHESGHIAGANAAGNKQTCNPFLRNTTARFFECFYAQVGLSRRECETHFPRYAAVEESTLNKSRFLPSSRSTYCTIYVEPLNGMILGGEILGGDETNGLANLLALCITRKVPISELERVSFSYTPTTSPLVHPFALLGRKGTKLLTTRKRYV